MVGKTIVNQGRVVRPSQLIRSVRRTRLGSDQEKHEVTVARRRASMLALPLMRAGAARGERQLKLAGIAALGR
jgi:hypothetical protein